MKSLTTPLPSRTTPHKLSPTPRANPFPKVTDPFCRLPLPTLFHRPEAVNLGDLLRLLVRSGEKSVFCLLLFPLDFQGSSKAHRTSQRKKCSAGRLAPSPANPIPGPSNLSAFYTPLLAVKKKRELFPELLPTSRGSLVLPRSRHVVKMPLFPHPGPGILTCFPFDRVRT